MELFGIELFICIKIDYNIKKIILLVTTLIMFSLGNGMSKKAGQFKFSGLDCGQPI